MPTLINPSGRIVIIDDPEQYEELLKTPGFSKPTFQEEQTYLNTRSNLVSEMKSERDKDKGIYIATVSQGGKDGYGIASSKLIEGLTKLGVNISPHFENQKVALLFHNPYSILRLESPVRIIYTMFESDKIPDDWKEYLEAADLVVVPSKWCADVFKKAGIDTKVIPLGFDDKVFKYKKRMVKRAQRKDFVFLHYNAFNIRKGFPEVFKAFNKAFSKDEPVKMIFKTTLDQIPLPITKKEYPNIEIIQGKFSEKELVKVIERSDCFVFPSRGEGFAMTPLETMATGIPAIVPNAHGITEYFNPDYMYEVKVKETCPALYSRYKGIDVGNMVVCDVDHLASQMRYIYEHQDEARDKGKKAAEYVKAWTFDKTAEKFKELFDEYFTKPIAEKPIRNVLALEQVA